MNNIFTLEKGFPILRLEISLDFESIPFKVEEFHIDSFDNEKVILEEKNGKSYFFRKNRLNPRFASAGWVHKSCFYFSELSHLEDFCKKCWTVFYGDYQDQLDYLKESILDLDNDINSIVQKFSLNLKRNLEQVEFLEAKNELGVLDASGEVCLELSLYYIRKRQRVGVTIKPCLYSKLIDFSDIEDLHSQNSRDLAAEIFDFEPFEEEYYEGNKFLLNSQLENYYKLDEFEGSRYFRYILFKKGFSEDDLKVELVKMFNFNSAYLTKLYLSLVEKVNKFASFGYNLFSFEIE